MQFFFNEGGLRGLFCKNSCVSIVDQEGANKLIFYIFGYVAEYGAACSAD